MSDKTFQTPPFRLAWPKLTKEAVEKNKGKFAIGMLFRPNDQLTDKEKNAIKAMMAEVKALGDAAHKNKKWFNPIKKQDDKVGEYDGYQENAYCLEASTKYKPQMLERDGSEVLNPAESLYAGCWCYAIVQFDDYPSIEGGKPGVKAYIKAVKKIRDVPEDQRFGKSHDYSDDFDAMVDPDDDIFADDTDDFEDFDDDSEDMPDF